MLDHIAGRDEHAHVGLLAGESEVEGVELLVIESEKFICLSSFATVLRLTRMPKAESSAAIFFVVLRVHLRPLTDATTIEDVEPQGGGLRFRNGFGS